KISHTSDSRLYPSLSMGHALRPGTVRREPGRGRCLDEAVAHAEPTQQCRRTLDGWLAGQTGGKKRHCRVLRGCQRGQQIKLLEDDPQVLAPELHQAVTG